MPFAVALSATMTGLKTLPTKHRERDVLRHHLADDHVQERHEQQRDDEREHAADLLRDAGPVQRHLEQVVDGGFRDVEDEQRAHRDAELAHGEHERRVLHRPQGRLGGPGARLRLRLDLRAARGDDGELGADEEGVDEQQHNEPQDAGERFAHRVFTSLVSMAGCGVGV
jgi:hypothetical protein